VNNLNSVLIEGVISDDIFKNDDSACLWLKIKSRRYYIDGAKTVEKVSSFTIEVSGKQAETVYEKVKQGQGVRVVGCMESEDNGFVKIIAEHIEFRSSTSTPTKAKMRKEKK